MDRRLEYKVLIVFLVVFFLTGNSLFCNDPDYKQRIGLMIKRLGILFSQKVLDKEKLYFELKNNGINFGVGLKEFLKKNVFENNELIIRVTNKNAYDINMSFSCITSFEIEFIKGYGFSDLMKFFGNNCYIVKKRTGEKIVWINRVARYRKSSGYDFYLKIDKVKGKIEKGRGKVYRIEFN